MSLPIQGIKFHSYLLNKLISTPNESKLRIVQQILKPCPAQIDRARETFALFAKLTGPEPFAHMCALSAALVDQPFVWPFQYRIDNRFTIPIPDSVVSVLYDLGRLVMMFPKLCYLNVTVDEYIERRLAFKMFFNDSQYSYLHAFWRNVGKMTEYQAAYTKEPLVVTPELCEQVKNNVIKIVRKLFKGIMMEQINDMSQGNAETLPEEELGGILELRQDSNSTIYEDVRDKVKGTVMLQLVDEARIRHLTKKIDEIVSSEMKAQLKGELKARSNEQAHDKLQLLKDLLPADYLPRLVEIVQDMDVAEMDILEFLLCAMGCYEAEPDKQVKVKEQVEKVI